MQSPCAGVTQCRMLRLGLLLHQVLEDINLGTKDCRRLPGGSDPHPES